MPKFPKGSQEAKDHMASLRAKRGSKPKCGCGKPKSKCGCGLSSSKIDVVPAPAPAPAPAPPSPPKSTKDNSVELWMEIMKRWKGDKIKSNVDDSYNQSIAKDAIRAKREKKGKGMSSSKGAVAPLPPPPEIPKPTTPAKVKGDKSIKKWTEIMMKWSDDEIKSTSSDSYNKSLAKDILRAQREKAKEEVKTPLPETDDKPIDRRRRTKMSGKGNYTSVKVEPLPKPPSKAELKKQATELAKAISETQKKIKQAQNANKIKGLTLVREAGKVMADAITPAQMAEMTRRMRQREDDMAKKLPAPVIDIGRQSSQGAMGAFMGAVKAKANAPPAEGTGVSSSKVGRGASASVGVEQTPEQTNKSYQELKDDYKELVKEYRKVLKRIGKFEYDMPRLRREATHSPNAEDRSYAGEQLQLRRDENDRDLEYADGLEREIQMVSDELSQMMEELGVGSLTDSEDSDRMSGDGILSSISKMFNKKSASAVMPAIPEGQAEPLNEIIGRVGAVYPEPVAMAIGETPFASSTDLTPQMERQIRAQIKKKNKRIDKLYSEIHTAQNFMGNALRPEWVSFTENQIRSLEDEIVGLNNRLSGIEEPIVASVQGYGLMKKNVYLKGHSRICGGRMKRGREDEGEDPALYREPEFQDDDEEDDDEETLDDLLDRIEASSDDIVSSLAEERKDLSEGLLDNFYGNSRMERLTHIADIQDKIDEYENIDEELRRIYQNNPTFQTASRILEYMRDYTRRPITALVSPVDWRNGLLFQD